jgi:hypothetical protein
MERRVMLTTRLYQGSGGTLPGGRTASLVGSLHQLPGQTLVGLSQLHHLGLRGGQLLPNTWGEKIKILRTAPI